MNYRLVIGSLGITLSFFSGAAYAENIDHVRQLLTTGDCPGCDLSDMSLNGLALPGANLQGANLSGSQLQNVDLTRADLTAANLSGVHISGTNFTGANLQNADLSDATSVFICNSSFYGYTDNIESCVTEIIPLQILPELCAEEPELAEKIAVEFGESENICSEEGLINISLYSAYSSLQLLIQSLQLRGANLRGANLQNADFSGAELSYATLDNAQAAGANFSYARLFNADVTGLLDANLTDAWEDWTSLGEWMIAAQTRIEDRAKQEESKIYIGAMGRAQQAYYLETSEFATELPLLGLGISEENEQYRFGVLEPESSDQIVHYALAKTDNLPSFLGVVSVEIEADTSYAVTTSSICEAEMAGAIAVSDLPEIEPSDDFFNCPAGWKLVE